MGIGYGRPAYSPECIYLILGSIPNSASSMLKRYLLYFSQLGGGEGAGWLGLGLGGGRDNHLGIYLERWCGGVWERIYFFGRGL